MLFKQKIIISGDVYEVYRYEKTQGNRKGVGRVKEASDTDKVKNRYTSSKRARNKLRRIINANAWQYENSRGELIPPKFVTLTFADNITDLREANKIYKKFVQRLNYKVYGEKKNRLKYSVVVEFQKRGAVHYHVLFYNLEYMPANELAKIWGQGFIKINSVDEVDNLGAYVTKYMGKDLADERLAGEKSYFNSRGLKQPLEVKEKEQVEKLAAALPVQYLKYESVYENEYTGRVYYKQYNLALKSRKQTVLYDTSYMTRLKCR